MGEDRSVALPPPPAGYTDIEAHFKKWKAKYGGGAIPFNLAAARADGVPDVDAAHLLGSEFYFDVNAALEDGHTPTAIAEFLAPRVHQPGKDSGGPAPKPPAVVESATWAKYYIH